MVMNEAASAPVVSATSRETPTGFGDRASAYSVLPVARGDEAGAGHAVVGRVVPAAHLLEAKHELAELLPSSLHPKAVEMTDVALGGAVVGWGGGRRRGA